MICSKSNSKRVDTERMSSEFIILKNRLLDYQERIKGLSDSQKSSGAVKEKQKNSYGSAIAEQNEDTDIMDHKRTKESYCCKCGRIYRRIYYKVQGGNETAVSANRELSTSLWSVGISYFNQP